MYGTMPAALATEIETAVASISIPAATGSNQTQIDTARRNRVNAAIFLALVSPEFQVQKLSEARMHDAIDASRRVFLRQCRALWPRWAPRRPWH
jgi:hypothetical protein